VIFQGAESATNALFTWAIAPDTVPTYGFYGLSYPDIGLSEYSYGVLGVATHSGATPDALAYGLFGGDSDNTNAYAGYFTGNVKIESPSELCLIDEDTVDCRTDWPLGSGTNDYLLLQTEYPTIEQEGVTVVEGLGQFFAAAVGNSEGHELEVTCGDGVCTEDPDDCPDDCPEITLITAVWQDNTSALFTWTSNTNMHSVVEYGLTSSYGDKLVDVNFVTNHSVVVDGLNSANDYHYRVGGATQGIGVFLFSADLVLPFNDVDTTPPPVVPSLGFNLHLPDGTPGDEEFVQLNWNHPGTDLPEGSNSGFSHFNVFNTDSGFLGTVEDTPTAIFRDDSELYQGITYTYFVTAVDNNGNESDATWVEVYVGLVCPDNNWCQTRFPFWTFCCNFKNFEGDDVKTCKETPCEASSPIMKK